MIEMLQSWFIIAQQCQKKSGCGLDTDQAIGESSLVQKGTDILWSWVVPIAAWHEPVRNSPESGRKSQPWHGQTTGCSYIPMVLVLLMVGLFPHVSTNQCHPNKQHKQQKARKAKLIHAGPWKATGGDSPPGVAK